MYREIGSVKPIFGFSAISQPEYNQYAITTVLQFKIIGLSYFEDLYGRAKSDCVIGNMRASMSTRPTQGSLEKARTEQNIAYIRQMLGELRSVAHGENAGMLCYLIEMAYLEAGDLLEGRRPVNAGKNPYGRL